MPFQGRGFFDKDLVLACWYDLEVNNGGQYGEEFIDPVVAPVAADKPTVVSELPPSRRRNVELQVAAFVPILLAPLASVVDGPPWRSRSAPFDDIQHVEPPAPARPDNVYVVDAAPWRSRPAPFGDISRVDPPAQPDAVDELPASSRRFSESAAFVPFIQSRASVTADTPWRSRPAPFDDIQHIEPPAPGRPDNVYVVDELPRSLARAIDLSWSTTPDPQSRATVIDDLPPRGRPADLPWSTVALEHGRGFVADGAPSRSRPVIDLSWEIHPIEDPDPDRLTTVVDELPPGRRATSDLSWSTSVLEHGRGFVADEAPSRSRQVIDLSWEIHPIEDPDPDRLTTVVDELPPGRRATSDLSWSTSVLEHGRGFVADEAPGRSRPVIDLSWEIHPIEDPDPDRLTTVVDELPPVGRAAGDLSWAARPFELPRAPVVVDDAPVGRSWIPDGGGSTLHDGAAPWVVDELPRSIGRELTDQAHAPAISLIVPFFEASYPDLIYQAPWLPVDEITRVLPPAPPPRPTPSAGGSSGGIAGGGWTRTCDYVIEPLCDLPPEGVSEELGGDIPEPDPSIPAKLAGLLGKSATGFAIGKTATRLAGQHFGKHGAGVAALASVIATAKLTAKVDKKSGLKKMQVPIVAGNVLAAIDDLVEIYVPEEQKKQLQKPAPTGTAKLEIVRDPVAFVTRAKELGGEINVSRMQGRNRAGDEVIMLRYTVGGGVPLALVIYEETLHRGPDGRFDARNTLLAAIRKHRP